MNNLYAPWRSNYVTSKDEKIQGCVFCHIVNNPDKHDELGVLYFNDDFFIVMNKYPYNPGHFMIIPNFHTSNLEDLDTLVWQKMSIFAQKSVRLLKDVLSAQGVNIGMNLGQAAGAGIAEHIHLHLVPRWTADTNFTSAINNTRVYSSDFNTLYKELKEKSKKYFNDN